ncbi:MAG: hypothetical protein GQ527_06325 [Bacteroidales bacterium]|nr:hypothetical protein [Bacteroidales bacterium]
MKQLFYSIITILIFSSCSQELEKISENDFIGTWELTGREMFNGIQISIQKKNGNFEGRIIKLNKNKYIQFFADSNDIWVSGISRSSNYQFELKEKKIGKELFSLYGLGTTEEFKLEFIDHNTIGLAKPNSDPQESEIKYIRIEKNAQ